MAHQITACTNKNADWKVVSILNAAGDIIPNVSVNRVGKKGDTFPNFDEIQVGAKVEGVLWESDKGKTYLFPPRQPKGTPQRDMSPALNNGATAEIMNALNLKIIPALEMLSEEIIRISKKVHASDYPEYIEGKNDANKFDDIKDSVPF